MATMQTPYGPVEVPDDALPPAQRMGLDMPPAAYQPPAWMAEQATAPVATGPEAMAGPGAVRVNYGAPPAPAAPPAPEPVASDAPAPNMSVEPQDAHDPTKLKLMKVESVAQQTLTDIMQGKGGHYVQGGWQDSKEANSAPIPLGTADEETDQALRVGYMRDIAGSKGRAEAELNAETALKELAKTPVADAVHDVNNAKRIADTFDIWAEKAMMDEAHQWGEHSKLTADHRTAYEKRFGGGLVSQTAGVIASVLSGGLKAWKGVDILGDILNRDIQEAELAKSGHEKTATGFSKLFHDTAEHMGDTKIAREMVTAARAKKNVADGMEIAAALKLDMNDPLLQEWLSENNYKYADARSKAIHLINARKEAEKKYHPGGMVGAPTVSERIHAASEGVKSGAVLRAEDNATGGGARAEGVAARAQDARIKDYENHLDALGATPLVSAIKRARALVSAASDADVLAAQKLSPGLYENAEVMAKALGMSIGKAEQLIDLNTALGQAAAPEMHDFGGKALQGNEIKIIKRALGGDTKRGVLQGLDYMDQKVNAHLQRHGVKLRDEDVAEIQRRETRPVQGASAPSPLAAEAADAAAAMGKFGRQVKPAAK